MSTRTEMYVLVAILGLQASVARGASEDEEEDGLPRYQADEVVVTGEVVNAVATKLPLSMLSTPVSVSVVNRALMESQDGVVLGDALENVSGVNVQTGFGVHDFFSVRGFGSLGNGLVLTDGAAEPEVTFYNLYNLERVEVLKGPGAFLYGANPLSGTVNLVRKQPTFDQSFARLSSSAGSFGSFKGTTDLGWSDADAGIAVRLNGLWRQSDNYRDDKDNWALAINPALTWRVNDKSTLQVNLEYAGNDYQSDAGLPIVDVFSGLPVAGPTLADVSRKRSYQSPFDDSEQDIVRVRVDYEIQLSESLTVRDKLYYTDFEWPSTGTLFNGVFPNAQGSQDVLRALLLLDDAQTFLGNQLEAVVRLNAGGVKHTMLAGVELAKLTDEFTLDVGFLPNIDLNTPVETAAEPLFLIPQQSTSADASSFVFAPYFIDHIEFNERLEVFAGGRFDAISYEDDVSGTDRSYSQFSPLVGLVVAPNPAWSLYGSFGQAFSPPSSQVVGDRDAESGMQVEAGVRGRWWDGRCVAAAAVYQLKKSNIAIPDQFGISRETGNQRSRGLELELGGEIRPGWRAAATYAFSSAELTDFSELVTIITAEGPVFSIEDRSGNDAAFAPDHIANVWTFLELGRGIAAGAGLRYVSGQKIAPDSAFEIDSALTLNASVSYQLNDVRLRLNARNLTDTEYETRGFGTTSVIPADPIGLTATVEWQL